MKNRIEPLSLQRGVQQSDIVLHNKVYMNAVPNNVIMDQLGLGRRLHLVMLRFLSDHGFFHRERYRPRATSTSWRDPSSRRARRGTFPPIGPRSRAARN